MLRAFGRYRLRREIAAGTLVVTHDAVEGDGRWIVRVSKMPAKLDADARARLDADAKAAAALPPHHCDPVRAHGVQHGLPYTAHPFQEVRPASAVSWTPRLSALVARDVAHALADAHRLGLVHGDVALDHVFVDDRGRARLSGFALAPVVLLAAAAMPQLARLSAGRRAPELGGGGLPTPASDLYALGRLIEALAPDDALRERARTLTSSAPSERGDAAGAARALAALVPNVAATRSALGGAVGLDVTLDEEAPLPDESAPAETARRRDPAQDAASTRAILDELDGPSTDEDALSDATVAEIMAPGDRGDPTTLPPPPPPDGDTEQVVLPEARQTLDEPPTFVEPRRDHRTELIFGPPSADELPIERTAELSLPEAAPPPPPVDPRAMFPPPKPDPVKAALDWLEERGQRVVLGWELRWIALAVVGAFLMMALIAVVTMLVAG